MSADSEIPTNFWADDFLKRREESLYLTKYLAARYQAKKSELGFVLAVNGDWGLGKSFMIDRWSKDLQRAGHPVVMFNSWENDFTSEPLVAFIAELNSALSIHFDTLPRGEEFRQKWLTTAKAVLVPTLKLVGMAALKYGAGIGLTEIKTLIGTEESAVGADAKSRVGEDGLCEDRLPTQTEGPEEGSKIDTKELSEKLTKVIEDELKSHTNVKRSINDFKIRLSLLVTYLESQSQVQLPIFIFIDELDRCRPDYAIKLLEGVKHLFGIPGIHFIVATNLPELAHSIRAVYGEQFSAERYLKRFFDMEYSLPEPQGLEFAAELMVPLAELTEATFITGLDNIYLPDQFPARNLSFIFHKYALAFGLKLRDQQQAAKVLEASLLTLGDRAIHVHFLIFLVTLYQKNSQVYHVVAQAKNLLSPAFSDTITRSNLGQFIVPNSDNGNTDKTVAIREIGELYFSLIDGERFQGQRSYDFPASMILNARDEQSRKSLASYVEIVRRAGRFAK